MGTDTVEFLRKVSAFAELSEEGLQRLAGICEEAETPAGATIIHEGEEGDCVYIIREGEVEISITISLKLLPGEMNDREKSLVRLHEGAFFGEMSFLFDTDHRTATAVANTPVKLLRIHSADFRKFAESDYKSAYFVTRNIAQTIAKRLRKTNQDVIKLTTVLSVALSKSMPRG